MRNNDYLRCIAFIIKMRQTHECDVESETRSATLGAREALSLPSSLHCHFQNTAGTGQIDCELSRVAI